MSQYLHLSEESGTIMPLSLYNGHTSTVSRIVIDNNQAYSSSHDKTIKKWDLNEQKETTTFLGHTDAITDLLIVKNSLYSISDDSTVRLWDTEKGKELKKFEGHKDSISAICVKDKTLYTGSADQTIRIFDIESCSCKKVIDSHSGLITSVFGFGDNIYSASVDKSLIEWDMATGQPKKQFLNHNSFITCVINDEKFIYTGHKNGQIKIWDPSVDRCVRICEGFTYPITKLFVNGDQIIAGCWDGMIGIFSISTGQLIKYFIAHSGRVNDFQIVDNVLYSIGRDNTMKGFNIKNWKCDYLYEGHTSSITSLAVCNECILTGSKDTTIQRWDLAKGKKGKGFSSAPLLTEKEKNRIKRKRDSINILISLLTDKQEETNDQMEKLLKASEQYTRFGINSGSFGKMLGDALYIFGVNDSGLEDEQDELERAINQEVEQKEGEMKKEQQEQQEQQEEESPLTRIKSREFELGKLMMKFGELQKSTEENRKEIFQFLSTNFPVPIMAIKSEHLKKIQNSLKKARSIQKDYLNSYEALVIALKKKKPDPQRILNLEQALAEQKRNFTIAKLDLDKKFDELDVFTKSEIFGNIITLIQLELNYYKNTYDLLMESEPMISNLTDKIAIDQSKKLFEEMKNVKKMNVIKKKKENEEENENENENENEKEIKIEKEKENENENENEKENEKEKEQIKEKLIKGVVKVTEDYQATNKNELTLKKDDVIEILKIRPMRSVGICNGLIGVYPNYITKKVENK
ncbi:f-box/wd repeat-containing protein pof1 [Anaeramoeba flamelloides]|uniref:F-box/wd repeat-containing protein pof1 n=1 Tax=Anaeramoeba flamelloides TaxID=1746091 RepID=A0ABQ8YUG2_9EUKA|nr:f-box/wd repeat-containing protein pof1 [Anaeramoeba flamelloides]